MARQSDIKITIATKLHRSGILRLAEIAFIKGEPVRVALNVQWKEVQHDWEKLVDTCIEEKQSHVAINDEDAVIGLRLSRISDLSEYSSSESINNFIPPGVVRTIEDHLTADWATVLVNGHGKTFTKLLQFLALAVHPDYAGRGIAVKMCEENMELGKRLGCEYCSVVASNFISQRVFEKLGFTMVKSIKFDEFYDKSGQKVVDIKDKKQTGSKWFIKLL